MLQPSATRALSRSIFYPSNRRDRQSKTRAMGRTVARPAITASHVLKIN